MWNTYDSFGYGMHMPYFFGLFAPVILAFVLIVIALKGYTLWHAARRDEKWWFIALLIVNTAGILELIYIIFFLKKFSVKTENQTFKEDRKVDHVNESK
jgi:peptidoglycan biosynthesis protein MviN/MurJ (putative lipid II flippase)